MGFAWVTVGQWILHGFGLANLNPIRAPLRQAHCQSMVRSNGLNPMVTHSKHIWVSDGFYFSGPARVDYCGDHPMKIGGHTELQR